MDQAQAWADANPFIFIATTWLWIGGVIVLSVFLRRARGLPIFAPQLKDALFIERRVSGRSLRNLITRLGGAKNVLFVAVTADRVIVQPHFPFSLMFMPEIYGLDCEINRSRLRKVSIQDGLFGRKKVLVEFSTPSHGEEEMELRLQNHELFLKAVGEMKAGGARR